MSYEARLDKIPNFVKAKTPSGLRRLMFENNMRKNVQYVYHAIQFASGYWYAWYYEEIKASEVDDSIGAG